MHKIGSFPNPYSTPEPGMPPEPEELDVVVTTFRHGGHMALLAMYPDGRQAARLTVNLDEDAMHRLDEAEFYLNADCNQVIADQLIRGGVASKLAEGTKPPGVSGFNTYPVWTLSRKAREELRKAWLVGKC